MRAAAAKGKRIGLDLTEGSIGRGLMVFALPIVLTNVIQQLYSLVDLMVIGQYAGSRGTVGVSVGGEIADLVLPIATAFSNAGQIYIAQLVGASLKKKMKQGIGTLFALMMGMSIVLMAVCILGCGPILRLLNCPQDAFGQARAYMLITAAGIPFIFGYNAVCGVLRGMGESRRPLLFVIIAAFINIILDIVLVAVFHLGAVGTAAATVLSQLGSFMASCIYVYRHSEQFGITLDRSLLHADREALRVIVMQGLPQAIRSMLVRFSLLWVNSNINGYGLTASATNSVGNKIQKFLDVFTMGVTQAAGAMVGQNLGAKKQDRAAKTVWYTLACTMCIAAVLAAVSFLLPRQLFGLFTKDKAVLEMGVVYMHVIVWHFVWSAVTSSLQSMVIGSGYASMNFFIGILDGVVCKIGLSLIFTGLLHMGVSGYFTAIAWSRAIPGVICAVFFLSGKWKTRRLLTE